MKVKTLLAIAGEMLLTLVLFGMVYAGIVMLWAVAAKAEGPRPDCTCVSGPIACYDDLDFASYCFTRPSPAPEVPFISPAPTEIQILPTPQLPFNNIPGAVEHYNACVDNLDAWTARALSSENETNAVCRKCGRRCRRLEQCK